MRLWLANCRLLPAYDFKLALTRVIEPNRGTGAELATLQDAARFIGQMKPWCQARPHWDFAAELLLKAAQSGKEAGIEAATAQMERALRLKGGCDLVCACHNDAVAGLGCMAALEYDHDTIDVGFGEIFDLGIDVGGRYDRASASRPFAFRGGVMKQIFGIEIPRTLEDVCQPRRLALLIYDMQVGITSQVKDGDLIVERVARTLEAARGAGVRIIFTRHMSLPKELMGAFAYRMAMAWQHVDDPEKVVPWFLRDSPGFALVADLQPLPSEVVFDKITMSAFEGTPLTITLRDCGVSAIAIAGIAMEVGIEPTARHAADLGFIPVIIADACGSGHEDAAKRSLDSLAFAGDSLITDTSEFCRLLRAKR